MKRGVVTIDFRSVFVDVARTPEEQELGLRGRPSLDVNGGMLFRSPHSRLWQMTMRDVPFPLVIVFIQGHTITAVEFAHPNQAVVPAHEATSVLEMSPAWFVGTELFTSLRGKTVAIWEAL